MNKEYTLIGPFRQLITLQDLPLKGPLRDDQSKIISDAGILVRNGKIVQCGAFELLRKESIPLNPDIAHIDFTATAIPSFIDSHTHICFAGSRARDYALRNSGASYLEIAKAGGGIWETVSHTRQASGEELEAGILKRIDQLINQGVTTLEIKSGYGLSVEEELKMLNAIKATRKHVPVELVSTCLGAHIKPKDYTGNHAEYLKYLEEDLLPQVKKGSLASRVDIFIEEEAFSTEISRAYLEAAKQMGFEITVHADQFSVGGSRLAVEMNAVSADHLEASSYSEIELLAKSDTVATALPGASIGLGCRFTPARQLLDAGACLAIASDWNPGSAPMGDLLVEASVLASFEKLSNLEVLAGMTFRAAFALRKNDIGRLQEGFLADINVYETGDFNEIFYHQGMMKPVQVWKSGLRIK